MTRTLTSRVSMFISEAEREAIEDHRYLNRIPTFSEAFRSLAALGLQHTTVPTVKPVRRRKSSLKRKMPANEQAVETHDA